MNKTMKEWSEELIHGKTAFLPICFYPFLEKAGVTAEEAMKDGKTMAAVMAEAVRELPSAACSISAIDVTADPEAFGCSVIFDEKAAPRTSSAVVSTEEDVDALEIPDVHKGRLEVHYEAVREARKLITDRPVFGNLLGPFTLAGSLMKYADAMINVVKNPAMMEKLAAKCTDFLIQRAEAFKEAGADGILLDEAMGGVIPPKMSKKLSAAYIRKIVDAVQGDDFVVMMHNCSNIKRMMSSIYDTGCRIISVGNALDMKAASETLPADSLIMGNLDPMLLISEDAESIREKTAAILDEMADVPNFILSPGCDCAADTKIENLRAMAEVLEARNAS